jgi:hypothetical protein
MSQSLRMQLFHPSPLVLQPIQAADGAPSSEFPPLCRRSAMLPHSSWLAATVPFLRSLSHG